MVALRVKSDLVVADKFRDGNVPHDKPRSLACKRLLRLCRRRCRSGNFRGNSACHEHTLIG